MHKGFAPAGKSVLGAADIFDHQLVGLTRIFSKGENAVTQENKTDNFGIGGVDRGHALGQVEAGNAIGHIGETIAKDVARKRLAIRLVSDGQHRCRMGVVDKFVRQKRVQQRFYRRVWRRRVQKIDALVIDHVFIREPVQRKQTAQRRQPYCR